VVVVEVAVLGVLRGGDMERECEGQGVVVVVGRKAGGVTTTRGEIRHIYKGED